MENRTMTWQNELERALAALISSMAEPDRKENDSAVERLRLQVTDVISRHQILTVKGGVKLDHGGEGKPDHPAAGRSS